MTLRESTLRALAAHDGVRVAAAFVADEGPPGCEQAPSRHAPTAGGLSEAGHSRRSCLRSSQSKAPHQGNVGLVDLTWARIDGAPAVQPVEERQLLP